MFSARNSLSTIGRNMRSALKGAVVLGISSAALVVGSGFSGGSPAVAVTQPPVPMIDPREWAEYKNTYIRSDGRVVDVENRGVSHSEGQGYGLLIATYANDRSTFDRVWTFTRNKLQIRSDGLLSWRYIPGAQPHVPDMNNATDGDILVAYGLVRAALQWNDKRYLAEADKLIVAIGRNLIADVAGMKVLKPGVAGFDRSAGNRGPIVNLSYYVYGALRTFEMIRPEFAWDEVVRDGRALTQRAKFGQHQSSPDWIAIDPRTGAISIPQELDAKSGYNAVRIPLYMVGGNLPGADISQFDWSWNVAGEGYPVERAVPSGAALSSMNDLGYRFIASLSRCVARGVSVPNQEVGFRTTTYYGSSLHLLGLAAAREYHPGCVDPSATVEIGSRTTPGAYSASASPTFSHARGGQQPVAQRNQWVPKPSANSSKPWFSMR